jgi:hypothetical protein
MSSYQSQSQTGKTRTNLKPILRKLTQSEKNSLDLDRPAAEQDGLGIFDYGTGSRSAHDVAFNHTTRRGYHNRSTSGTSQFSTATTGSGPRTGSFVHPFQQTPRPYTPPIAASYQNSLRESEHSNSPVLDEDEDKIGHQTTFRSTTNLSSLSNRTPSLTGGTTSSSPVISQPLRIQTKQPTSSRLILATSHTSLHNTLYPDLLSSDLTSPTDTMSPSTIRTSIDKGFRIRSRSDVDTGVRSTTIQEERRKFDEKEQLKNERLAQLEVQALEKRQAKEARRIEKAHRRSSASSGRPQRSRSDLTMPVQEKGGDGFARPYNSVLMQAPPFAGDEFEPPRRSYTVISDTKKKTHSTWTKFMMWLRTRFIRMGSSSSSSSSSKITKKNGRS